MPNAKRTQSDRRAAADDKVASLRRDMVKAEQKEPLRRRLLIALAEAAATPTQLSKRLGSPPESVSRLLRKLLNEGCVARERDASDRRGQWYHLTAEGERQLNRHYAFGAREKAAPPPDDDQALELLRNAIDRAVRIRRESNRLGEAAARLDGVVREAEKIGAYHVALEALAELAKTVRQNRGPDDRDELTARQEELIAKLNDISLGSERSYGAELAVPAAAHLKYTLGRAGERRGDDLPTREANLTAACSLYGQLAKYTAMPGSGEWSQRQAWSVISLAGNLRKQTRLERALRFATIAKRSFDQLEDEYGQAHCLLMFGFCLRLLGEFREALVCLDHAHQIAVERRFERIRTDTLMHMGEVQRCLGNLDSAHPLLNEAIGHAAEMDLLVTHAFAQSALASVEFQRGDLAAADDLFTRAGRTLSACDHLEGKALNTRRRAAVARKISEESRKPNYAAAERLVMSANECYELLRSPAGVAACAIEEGRVGMLRKKSRAPRAIEKLTDLLENRSKCDILELDPWVPHLLHHFARDVEDENLVERSERVMHDGRELLSERGAESVERIAMVMDDIKHEDEGEIDASAAEMGGEARRDPSAFEELNLLSKDIARGRELQHAG